MVYPNKTSPSPYYLQGQPTFHSSNKGIFYFGHDTGFMHLVSSLNIPTIAVFGDIPPYNYSDNMSSIGPDDNIFTDSSIKKILFEKAKGALDKFLNKHDL